MKDWDIFVYGDVNIDLVVPGVVMLPPPGQEEEVDTMTTFVGGGAALFTLGVAKLGLRSIFQGKVGADFYGSYILQAFEEMSVDTSLLIREEGADTGISICFTGEDDRSFLTARGTNADLRIENIDMEAVKKCRHIHITGYDGEKNHDAYFSFIKKVRSQTDVTVSFDTGWDVSGKWDPKLYDILPYIDVLFMNETELLHYTQEESVGSALQKLSPMGNEIVIKLGRKGSIAAKDGKIYQCPARAVQVKDTTGAGDSFNAGYIYGYLKNKSIDVRLQIGNICGALSVTELGGNTAFPNQETLKKYWKPSEAE